jgi:DNA-binding NtrC family response regulator
MMRALIEAQDDSIRAPHIRIQNLGGRLISNSSLPNRIEEVTASGFRLYQESLLRSYFERVLLLFEGDTAKLAEKLQISRATVYNRLKDLKIRNRHHDASEADS